jgi:hypothetical protein
MNITRKILLAIILLLIICTSGYIIMRWHYAHDHDIVLEHKHTTDTLTVGMIGDSWIAGHKLDSIVSNAFARNHVQVKIISSGVVGASSRMIYENMFLDTSNHDSSNEIFHNNLKYCVVIAGVNDAIGQYGGKFYAHHVTLMIKDLLKDHIRPVLVTLPEFGIQDAEDSFFILKRKRNELFGHITGNGFASSVRDYRKVLADKLDQEHLTDSIVKVDFDSVIMKYQDHKNLYFNPPHLNVKGNQLLGAYIVECILRDTTKANSVVKLQ